MANIFERASKKKLRFKTSRGQLSTEALWDLSLESLDTIAIAVNKRIKDNDVESFINKPKKELSDDKLRLDVLKHIIEYKLTLQERAVARQAKEAKIAQIKNLIVENENKELSEKPVAELQKMLEALQEE